MQRVQILQDYMRYFSSGFRPAAGQVDLLLNKQTTTEKAISQVKMAAVAA